MRLQHLLLLALPVPLLGVPAARGDTSTSSPGITQENQREERFYNFDHGRQSGGGFSDPSDLIRRLQGARNLQRATEPTDSLDAALDGFAWPDESVPDEEQGVNPVADSGSGPVQITGELFPAATPGSSEGATPPDEEEEEEEPDEEEDEGETTDTSTAPSTTS